MKLFKKLAYVFTLLFVVGFVFACNNNSGGNKTDTAPVISGAVDKTIEKGKKFIPLDGITANDAEDGDITDLIEYSGNVNVNKEGTYTAKYVVYDSDGNKAEVSITITVVYTDTSAPMIAGVANKTIVVGEEFTAEDGVSASDAIDGDLTSSIKITGSVDVWTIGEYSLVYEVSDKAGNKATSTRVVTVGLGNFVFEDNSLSSSEYVDGKLEATVSSGEINTTLTSYGLAELRFKASSADASELAFEMTNSTCKGNVTLTATETEYVVYFRISEEIIDGTFTITGSKDAVISDVSLKFGSAKDLEAPVITIPDDYNMVLPGNIADQDILKKFILVGVEANDNIDQVVTYKLDVDFGDLVLGDLSSEEEVRIFVVDNAGNVGEEYVKVQFMNVYDSQIIKDPSFDDATADTDAWGLNGGSGDPTLTFENGTMIHQTTNDADAGWDSASSPFIRWEHGTFAAGNYYLLKFDAKATVDRVMTVRIGLDTSEANGWIENFEGASNYQINLTTEVKTYYVLFYVHSDVSQSGMKTIKMELKLGSIYWGTNEKMNPVTFDNVQFYLLSNGDSAPTITLDETLPTTFGANEVVDFTKYITAYDLEDEAYITITSDMVDLTNVNMAVAGTYEVIFRVKDSANNESVFKLPIKVLAEADNEAPTITNVDGLATTVKQYSSEIVLASCVNIADNVDAFADLKIVIEGSVDLTLVGNYEVKYTVTDTSGNVGTHTITFVVTDGEAPKVTPITSVVDNLLQVEIGSELDLTTLVTVTDNVDGNMTVTTANIDCPDGVLENGVVVAAEGKYVVTYTFTDVAGNEAVYELTLDVVTEIVDNYFATVTGNSQGGSVLTFSDDCLTVTSTHGTAINGSQWGRFDIKSPAASYTNVRVTITSKTNMTLMFKVDADGNPYDGYAGNKQNKNVKADEVMVFEWDLAKLKIEATKLIKVVFYVYDPSGATTTGEFTLNSIEFYNTEQPEGPVIDPNETYVAQVTSNAQGASSLQFSEDCLTVTSTHGTAINGSHWGRFDFDCPPLGYTNAKLIISVKTSMTIMFKLDANGNPYDSYKGNKQNIEVTAGEEVEFEWDLVALNMDATKLLKAVFYVYDPSGETTSGEFTLVRIEFFNTEQTEEPGDDPVIPEEPTYEIPEGAFIVTVTSNSQGGSSYVFSEDKMSVTTTHGTGANQWGRFNFAALSENYTNAMVVVKGTGMALGMKLDANNPNNVYDNVSGNKQYKGLTGITVFEWDLASMGIEATKLEKAVFWPYDPNGSTTGTFEVLAIAFYNVKAEEPTPEEPTYEIPEGAFIVTVTSNSQGGSSYVFSEDKMSVTTTHSTGANQWGRFNFAALSENYTNAMVVVKGTGMALGMKLDANNPNNVYDSVSGNKQYKGLTGITVFEWDLASMGIEATKLEKAVFWPYDPNGSTTGTFEVLAIAFYNVETEEPTPEEPTPELEPINVIVTSNSQDAGEKYSFSNENKTVTCTYGTATSKWGRWNFDKVTAGYTKVTLVVKSTCDFSLLIKLDSATTPSNNAYDGVTGNKQYVNLKAGEEITITWDLATMNIPAENLEKVVFWAYDGTGATTTGTFELVSFTFSN